jgi:hypothetical protein
MNTKSINEYQICHYFHLSYLNISSLILVSLVIIILISFGIKIYLKKAKIHDNYVFVDISKYKISHISLIYEEPRFMIL